ncbi:cytochrome c oxidase accessory protein CcoG [Saccharospirillum mangrovi]|uniref:cytochrome c oxidase accessory protein CcoG n=1 Tax=Saccharospirillum mangrovi TaxID=2161747 RepID=UPI000D3B93D1|nr:cytochrome c oxidase accessory protein CcoG [Saccharospirillum mangrovi]
MTDKIQVKDVTDDAVKTVDLYQEREKIYVRRIKGFYRNLRVYGGAALFALYFGTLWLDWNGRQAVLFDLPARQFHILGITFWPQDFMLLSWALIICAFALFLVTVLAGRVWCGYTCPQSAWTWIFMFIEEKTEGKRNARIKLDDQPMTLEKFARKAAKHLLWLAVALATALTFVGYFVPIKTLLPQLVTFQVGGWAIFWIAFFTLATYGNAGWLREQVCIYMCPYARFQAVMFDQDTLIVSYDEARGEPRGARKRGIEPSEVGLGDCIDCELCVQVCPTGIDIRDGLQYECIGCAACIDACDSVMDKMGYEPGLIRYTTENSLEGKPSRILRPRLIGYGLALAVMIGLFSWVIATRVPLDLSIERGRGELHRITSEGLVENSYQISLMNMSERDHRYRLSVDGLDDLELIAPPMVEVEAGGVAEFPVRLLINPNELQLPNNEIHFTAEAVEDPSQRVSAESRFFGPARF